ncbi:MAG TPA: hypothetical protein VJS45_02580 [Acidimicrobiia bacterium]|nr:hypothetical protein [Acidimicrobiia bacterium]
MPQHGGVVPVHALSGDEFVSELNDDDDEVHVHSLVRRRQAGQQPFHSLRVREAEVKLLNELPIANNAVQRLDLEIVGP